MSAFEGHSEQYRPLGGYLALTGAFNALVAAGLVTAGFVAAPRTTRAIAAMFTVYAGADALQLAHGEVKGKID